MEFKDTLSCYISFLRSLYLVYQNAHWLSSGISAYSDHLLFQRLYENVLLDIDSTAEKFIGVFDKSVLDMQKQSKLIFDINSNYKQENSFEKCLKMEQDFQKLSNTLKKKLEENNVLSMGLDDLIMTNANNGESRIYLLKQKSQ